MALPTPVNSTPVTVAVFANAFVAVIIAVCKARYQIDFSGQEANLQILATGIGYFVSEHAQP